MDWARLTNVNNESMSDARWYFFNIQGQVYGDPMLRDTAPRQIDGVRQGPRYWMWLCIIWVNGTFLRVKRSSVFHFAPGVQSRDTEFSLFGQISIVYTLFSQTSIGQCWWICKSRFMRRPRRYNWPKSKVTGVWNLRNVALRIMDRLPQCQWNCNVMSALIKWDCKWLLLHSLELAVHCFGNPDPNVTITYRSNRSKISREHSDDGSENLRRLKTHCIVELLSELIAVRAYCPDSVPPAVATWPGHGGWKLSNMARR